MKTELKMLTPAMARDLLKRNTDNRPLRFGVVKDLLTAWSRGEWKVSHQGIAIGKSGKLLDGQHRLHFISELPEGTLVPINVSTDVDDSAFEAIDQGCRRTMSDIYGVSPGLAAVGRFFARIENGNQSAGLTNQYVRPFMEWAAPEFDALLAFCPTQRPVWSSAPVRAAAIYNIKRGHDADFVHLAYHSLVHSDIESMPHAVRVLTQQYMGGKIISARTIDTFCRALRAFDSKNTGRITKILIKDQTAITAEARTFITREMKKARAVPGQTVAKPAANSKRLKAA